MTHSTKWQSILSIATLLASIASLALSLWTFSIDKKSIRNEVYADIVQDVDAAVTPFYQIAGLKFPSDEERKTIKGVLEPLFRISNKTP